MKVIEPYLIQEVLGRLPPPPAPCGAAARSPSSPYPRLAWIAAASWPVMLSRSGIAHPQSQESDLVPAMSVTKRSARVERGEEVVDPEATGENVLLDTQTDKFF